MPVVVARLTSGPAPVADIGSGCGWSAIAIARGFDTVTVDGFDSDEASVRDATANAVAAGVADRCRFDARDADSGTADRYDLVSCFEALHDLAHPVAALAAMREMAAPDTPSSPSSGPPPDPSLTSTGRCCDHRLNPPSARPAVWWCRSWPLPGVTGRNA
jgi:SAM-dependent methyltransferase